MREPKVTSWYDRAMLAWADPCHEDVEDQDPGSSGAAWLDKRGWRGATRPCCYTGGRYTAPKHSDEQQARVCSRRWDGWPAYAKVDQAPTEDQLKQ